MKITTFNSILCLLIFFCSSTFYVKADNGTDVCLMEGSEKRSQASRPIPPMSMKSIQDSEEQDHEAVDDDSDVETGRKCKPDEQPTHPIKQHGTALGKCYIPDSIWSKTCRAVMAVNEHYKKVESNVDPPEEEEVVRQQLSPKSYPKCNDKNEDEGTVMRECRFCTIQLKHNAFGVQLTCYDCQQGKSDRTCHYIIKGNQKFIVSTTFSEMEGFKIPEMDVDEGAGNATTTKEKKAGKQRDKITETPDEL